LLVSDCDELGAAIYRAASKDLAGGRSRRKREVGKVTAKDLLLPLFWKSNLAFTLPYAGTGVTLADVVSGKA